MTEYQLMGTVLVLMKAKLLFSRVHIEHQIGYLEQMLCCGAT